MRGGLGVYSLAVDSIGHIWRPTLTITDALPLGGRTNKTRVAAELTAGVDRLGPGALENPTDCTGTITELECNSEARAETTSPPQSPGGGPLRRGRRARGTRGPRP